MPTQSLSVCFVRTPPSRGNRRPPHRLRGYHPHHQGRAQHWGTPRIPVRLCYSAGALPVDIRDTLATPSRPHHSLGSRNIRARLRPLHHPPHVPRRRSRSMHLTPARAAPGCRTTRITTGRHAARSAHQNRRCFTHHIQNDRQQGKAPARTGVHLCDQRR